MSGSNDRLSRDELESMTKDELQDLARDRDLAVSGTKDELVERLCATRTDDRPAAASFRHVISGLPQEFRSTTGMDIEQIAGLEPGDDGWTAHVQVVEQRRVPPSADIVGIYRVDLDAEGRMKSLHREQRNLRGRLEP